MVLASSLKCALAYRLFHHIGIIFHQQQQKRTLTEGHMFLVYFKIIWGETIMLVPYEYILTGDLKDTLILRVIF